MRTLRAALAPMGVHVSVRGLRSGDGGEIANLLGTSRARIVGMRDILRMEWAALGTELCAAVLCDFARTASGGQGGRQDDDHDFIPGAIGAWRAIAADAALAGMLPILATGEQKWIERDLVTVLQGRLGPLGVGLHVDELSAEIVGGAPGQWVRVSLPGHDGKLLRALTGLLEADHAHCIVGTRALLGEGWDCRAVDTLIDLGSARSHVAVNQVRGRALRCRDDRPEKVAHLWDVVVVPAMASATGVGLADLDRFLVRHQRFYAPAQDGALQRGAGHVHPALSGEASSIVGGLDGVGAELWLQAADRGAARARWRIGTPVGDDELLELRFTDRPEAPSRARALPRVHDLRVADAARAAELRLRWQRRAKDLPKRRAVAGLAAASVVGAGAAIAIAALPLTAVAALAVAGLGVGAGVGWMELRDVRALRQGARVLSDAQLVEALVQATLAASRHAGKRLQSVQVRISADGSGGTSLELRGGDSMSRQRLAEALDQALGGCPAPHYALEVAAAREVAPPFARTHDDPWQQAGLVPIPAAIGFSRKAAEAYASVWRGKIGPCTLVAVRQARAGDGVEWREPERIAWLRSADRQVQTRELLQQDGP